MPFIPVKAFALPELTTKHLIALFFKLTLFIDFLKKVISGCSFNISFSFPIDTNFNLKKNDYFLSIGRLTKQKKGLS